MTLAERIASREAHVAVEGLGYVGIPLALRAVQAGFCVTGLDSSESVVAGLGRGSTHLTDIDEASCRGRWNRPGSNRHLIRMHFRTLM